MELPDYKLPTAKGILMHTWEKSYGFVRKAGTIILAAAIVIWILSSFPAGVDYGSQESFIGMIGTAIAPVFAPLFPYYSVWLQRRLSYPHSVHYSEWLKEALP